MILPEDTKAPLPSDDEDDFDFPPPSLDTQAPPPPAQPYDPSSPSQVARALAEAYTDDFDPSAPYTPSYHAREYAYPPSPRSAVTLPLLYDPEGREGDIELGPAPPYSAVDTNPASSSSSAAWGRRVDNKPEPFLRRARRKFGRAVIFAIVVYCFITGLTVISMRVLRGPGGPHNHHPPYSDDPGADDGNFPPPPPPPPSMPDNKDWKKDGEPKHCIQLDPSIWAPYPDHNPPKQEIGSRRAANSTFILPTHLSGDLFAHLFGPAGVGHVLFSTYDAESEAEYEVDMATAPQVVVGSTGKGKTPKRGEYVRVTVESIYDMLEGVSDNEDATAENSPGWEMLEASKLCLMERTVPHSSPNATGTTEFSTRSNNNDDIESPDHRQITALGVGIYTNRPDIETHPEISDPLRFRLYIALPTLPTGPSLAESIMEGLIGAAESIAGIPDDGHPHRWHHAPRGYVGSLAVSAGVADFQLPDLTSAGIGRLELVSSVGRIELGDVRAESIRLRTLGEITGKVGVSHNLDVGTPSGQVDLDLAITRRPPSSVFPHPDLPLYPAPPGNVSSRSDHTLPPNLLPVDIDACSAPPVDIIVMANNDRARIRHVDWDPAASCRGASFWLKSMVGSIDLHPHPRFEGTYRLSTSIGDISVDTENVAETEDPEGLDRWRNVTLTKRDRVATKSWIGEIHWEEGERPVEEAEKENEVKRVAQEEKVGGSMEMGKRGEFWSEREVEEEEERKQRSGGSGGGGGGGGMAAPSFPHMRQLKKEIVIDTSVGTIALVL